MTNDSSTRDKVRDAQRKIIDRLVEVEVALADLYGKYAHQFPEYGELWSVLADEERGHAAVLSQMHELLGKGHIFQGIGRFSPATVDPILQFIREETECVGKRSAKEAASNALRLETSLIESRFYDVVKTDALEFQNVARQLTQQTRAHMSRIAYVLGEATR